MINRIWIIVTIIAVFMNAIPKAVYAGEALTLERALSLAYENNPDMVEAGKNIDAAKGDMITVSSLAAPEAEFEISGLKQNDGGERDPHLGGFSITQRFDPPGVLGLERKISKRRISIREETRRVVWSRVYTEVRDEYSHIILDNKVQGLANEKLNIMRQFFGRVQQQFQSGKAIKNDLQRAKLELLNAENDLLAGEKEIRTEKAKLNLLLGRPMETPFEIEGELEEEELVLDLEKLTGYAMELNPEIKTEGLLLESKENDLGREQLNRFPALFAGFKGTNEDYDNDYSAVAGFSVPIWDLNQGGVKKAKAEKEAQAARFEAVRREIAFSVFEAYLNAELAGRQFALHKRSLDEANELLQLANLRYSEGEINFLSFLDQVKAAIETRVRYYQGLYNLSKAITELEKAVYMSVRQEGYLK
ncbi:MAG: TolC family protein [Candidatus Omnitrophica bacterium]|nr:TolC family protein [Candidatus Omnitrophota bacterium]